MEIEITGKRGPDIPKEFIGLFIEDINYAVDGGLYAELLENRNFESMDVYGGKDSDYYAVPDGLYAWDVYPKGSNVQLMIVQGSPVHVNNPHYLRVRSKEAGSGFCNKAYDGIYMRPNLTCHISFYARNVDYEGRIRVAIVKDGEIAVSKDMGTIKEDRHGWHKWEKYELDLTLEEEVRGAQFVVFLEKEGVMEFDFFSMVPEDAVCGIFRKDLAEMLKDLEPGFLRFPGGCVVEGNTLANRYQFKDTLGRPEERRYNWNRWAVHGNSEENDYHSRYSHYGQTCGIGFYEYFLLCEYLGAKPLPVLGVGLACQYQSHEKVEPEDPEIRKYIQDYLDLIEFANGDSDTGWGAVRAAMGHSEPFGLEMIGVGNEQWETEESRFFERYTLFEREIHKVHPEIKLIGTAGPELDSPRFEAAWQFYHGNEDKKDFAYAVDEHYYTSPQWFLSHLDYFDKVSRVTKVFFGEYAAHPAKGTEMDPLEKNNLEGALAEAAFLTGAARNCDAVVMTCYAPLLARIGYTQWSPDLIWFDDRSAYRTPSYYVQQMFSQNAGDYNVAVGSGEIPCQVSCDREKKEIIVKLVNPETDTKKVRLVLDPVWNRREEPVTEILLTGKVPTETNSIERETVRPQVNRIRLDDGGYVMQPLSFAVLRIPVKIDG
ncbi:MAG: alpha-L-arabinofuranosidase [Acetatifactor sp.]|nr:alpha-L-arabinofuranosidase [Acetatifactor sp.]